MNQSKITKCETSKQLDSIKRITERLEKVAKKLGLSPEDIPDLYEHIQESVDKDTGSFDQAGFVRWLENKRRLKGDAQMKK